MDTEETSLCPTQKPSQRLEEQGVLVQMMRTEKNKINKQAANRLYGTLYRWHVLSDSSNRYAGEEWRLENMM